MRSKPQAGDDTYRKTPLIFPHGGYRKLLTYRLGTLIYDATEAFCTRWLSRKDRTFDQMVQAARSGVANIIEGSEASATSKGTELKLTNVAKASQEELLTDFQAFLRQRGLPEWPADSPEAQAVRQARPETLDQLRAVMATLVAARTDGTAHCVRAQGAGRESDLSDLSDLSDGGRSFAVFRSCAMSAPSAPSDPSDRRARGIGSEQSAPATVLLEVTCNTMITLINQETYLLARQIARLRDGGRFLRAAVSRPERSAQAQVRVTETCKGGIAFSRSPDLYFCRFSVIVNTMTTRKELL